METIENQDGSITEIKEKTYLQITIKRDCNSPSKYVEEIFSEIDSLERYNKNLKKACYKILDKSNWNIDEFANRYTWCGERNPLEIIADAL